MRTFQEPSRQLAAETFDVVVAGGGTAGVMAAVATGSSPRVWGARPVAHEADRVLRFIPTGVGSTRERIDLALP